MSNRVQCGAPYPVFILRRVGSTKGRNFFVETLVVSVFGRDALHLQVVQIASSSGWLPSFLPTWIMPESGASCPRAQVGDGRREDENLERRDAALLVDAPKEVLRHHALQRFGERCANLVLLVGEHVDDAIDGLGGALRVQRAEHEVAGARPPSTPARWSLGRAFRRRG